MALKTVNDKILDKIIGRSVVIEGFKKSEVNRLVNFMNKELIPDVRGLLAKRLQKIHSRGLSSGVFRTKQLREMLVSYNVMLSKGIQQMKGTLKDNLKSFGLSESQWIKSTLQKQLPIDISLRLPTAERINSILGSKPFEGKFLNTWWNDLSKGIKTRTRQQLQIGLANGESTQAITRRLLPVLDKSRRDVSTIVRTAVNHVGTQARELTYKENLDVIKAVQWLSTLDGRTTLICISLDGKQFPVDFGDRPPVHMNCRSIVTPVTKSWEELGIKTEEISLSTRASMSGQVPAQITYPEWIRNQSKELQNKVLGVGRAQLWRDGKFKINQFVTSDLRTISLKELISGKTFKELTVSQEIVLPKEKPKIDISKFKEKSSLELIDKKGLDWALNEGRDEIAAIENFPAKTFPSSEQNELVSKFHKLLDELEQVPNVVGGNFSETSFSGILDKNNFIFDFGDKVFKKGDFIELSRSIRVSSDLNKDTANFFTPKGKLQKAIREDPNKQIFLFRFETAESRFNVKLPKSVTGTADDVMLRPGVQYVIDDIEGVIGSKDKEITITFKDVEIPSTVVESAPLAKKFKGLKALNDAEEIALDAWIQSDWIGIRDIERLGLKAAEVKGMDVKITKDFHSMLKKAPIEKKTIYRGGKFSEFDAFELKVQSQLTKEGSIVELRNSVSTSTSKQRATDFILNAFEKTKDVEKYPAYLLKIKPKTARSIYPYIIDEDFASELEAIMLKGTRYKVVKVVKKEFKSLNKNLTIPEGITPKTGFEITLEEL